MKFKSKTIHRCRHCMEICKVSKEFCDNCSTKVLRKEMCTKAQKIHRDNGLGNYICPLDCLELRKENIEEIEKELVETYESVGTIQKKK